MSSEEEPENITAKHELFSIQPQFPVADVVKAAEHFRDVFGFKIDFYHGDPPNHARVESSGEGNAERIYFHLAQYPPEQVEPNLIEMRMHVGKDIDGLFEVYRQRGADVVHEPISQPWGLREFKVRTLDGHLLNFSAFMGE